MSLNPIVVKRLDPTAMPSGSYSLISYECKTLLPRTSTCSDSIGMWLRHFAHTDLISTVVDSKEARARLSGWRSTAEVVAAIDDWCNVRRREPGAAAWRRLADAAGAIDTDSWRDSIRDQFDKPPEEAISVLRARAADVKAMQRQPARSLVLLVRMLWDAGDPGTAIPVLNIAERRFPDDFWVCIELGNLNMVDAPLPDPAEAVRFFSRAIALRPLSFAAHENLANALVDQNKFDDAIAEFRVAIKLNPANPDTYHDLGAALLVQEKTTEAIAALELAIRIRPDFA